MFVRFPKDRSTTGNRARSVGPLRRALTGMSDTSVDDFRGAMSVRMAGVDSMASGDRVVAEVNLFVTAAARSAAGQQIS
jgi:hypothetical protein